MITFDEFKKIDLRIGMVKEVNGDSIKVSCGGQEFEVFLKSKIQVGDKIVVALQDGMLVIPVVNGSICLKPEKDIEEGSKLR